jgi:Integrase core domain.
MRSNSRLGGLDYLPEEMRKPVILLATDKLTRLLVLEAHFKYEHAVSRSLLLSVLHKSFIIIGISKLVKSLSANCFVCQRRRAQPTIPLMSWLQNRVGVPNRAFAETGLDFAGPFETIQGRGKKRKQHYVLVLTCLQTRAVHFEATDNQKTDAVINALSRFTSCRGRPKVFVSDNQTSFRSASKELRDFYQFYLDNFKIIADNLNKEEEPIEWIFIPPRAPHFGGAWEIMVKAMKRALSVVSKDQPMTEDDFRTFLAKAMDMINLRPLLKHYSQETEHVLTPNDFLLGRCQVGIVPASENPPATKLGERWRQLESLSNRLWHRFLTEILPELSPRQKWKKEFNNLEVGTLVLIIDPNLPRNVWKLGIVEEVEISRDGFARSATVRTGDKSYNRPITKLIPLSEERF